MLLLAWVGGCSQSSSSPVSEAATASKAVYRGAYPIQAVATVGMVADLVRHVGGRHVQVTQMMGSGVDPHLYKSTRDDVQTLIQADIVFYAGLLLEGKMADTLVKVARIKPVIAVGERIDAGYLLMPDGAAGHPDPHVWMDVGAWAQCLQAVGEALVAFDPPHAEDYRAGAEAYARRLDGLHQYAIESLGSIPPDSRLLITSHDAFRYFGRAYGLDVRGVQGLSTESEAGLQQINALVDLILERNVQAVFIESSVPRKNVEALLGGAQARGHKLVIGGQLYSDAMGEPGTYEGTYLGMLDHNITVVTRALGGTAPTRGWQGKLSTR